MTRTRTLGTVVCTAVLALSLVGCGSSSDDKDKGKESAAKALTADEFKTQANALCAAANKDGEAYMADLVETSSDADVTEAVGQSVTRLTKLADDIETLKAPADMKDGVADMLASVRSGLAEMAKISSIADMMASDSSGGFDEANKKSKALGLDTCAE